MTPCVLGYICRCFGRFYCLHLQGPRSPSRMLHGVFLLVEVYVFCETLVVLSQFRGYSTSIVYTVTFVVSLEWAASTQQDIAAMRCLNDKGPTAFLLHQLVWCKYLDSKNLFWYGLCEVLFMFVLLWDLEEIQLCNFRREWAVIAVCTSSELQKVVDHYISVACASTQRYRFKSKNTWDGKFFLSYPSYKALSLL
jgi:hypothetical protein